MTGKSATSSRQRSEGASAGDDGTAYPGIESA